MARLLPNTFCAVGLLLIATLGAKELRAQSRAPTLVAVVRGDGVVLPFARFDGRQWAEFHSARGDAPQRYDMPDTWRIYPADGTKPQRVLGGSTVVFNTDGEVMYDTWGQLTDFAPRRVDRVGWRVGFALSETAQGWSAATFALHGGQSVVWRSIQRTTVGVFGQAETRALSQRPVAANVRDWPRVRSVPDSAERAKEPVELLSLYASRGLVGGARLYYVATRKVYRTASREDDCPPAVYYQVWFRQTPGTSAPSVVWELVTPGFECHKPGARPAEIVPYGAFTFGGRSFIVAETIGWEESYRQLFEVTPNTVRSAY